MSFSDFLLFNNFWWWTIVLVNFFGYFLLRYGMISDARLRKIIELAGSLLLALSFISILIFFGFLPLIGLILIFWVIVTPINEIIIRKITREGYRGDEEEIESVMQDWFKTTRKNKK